MKNAGRFKKSDKRLNLRKNKNVKKVTAKKRVDIKWGI
jgi:hypothetical protein